MQSETEFPIYIIMYAANTIKLKRILEFTNNKAGLKNTSLKSRVKLSDWMETYKNHQ